jgi:hypothetical protein
MGAFDNRRVNLGDVEAVFLFGDPNPQAKTQMMRNQRMTDRSGRRNPTSNFALPRRRQQPRHQCKPEQGARYFRAVEAGQIGRTDSREGFVMERAIATAGLANEVDAVNQ